VLAVGELGSEGPEHGPVGCGEVVAGDVGDDLEDVGGGGCCAAAVVGIQRQLVEAGIGHDVADGAFDQRVDEHRGEVAGQQPLHAGGVASPHGGDELGALELGVLLEVGLHL
jgi:hypothetical protein